LTSDLINVKRTLGLASALPRFFRERITLGQAEEGLKRLLDTRVNRFLEVARTQIYASPNSPYLNLLKHAGCEFSDLENGVKRYGLEATLAKLAGEGVYLTSDEFKGKTDVLRGGMSFRVFPKDFNPLNSSAGFTMQSSGASNQPTSTFQPLEWQTLRAMTEAVFYSAHDFYSGVHAVCEPVIAGRVNRVLLHAKLGIPTHRWFAVKVGVHSATEDSYHKLNARMVAKLGRWFGPGIADPEYVNLEDAKPSLQWIAENKRDGRNCRITAVVSTAARIARMAIETGLSLSGTRFHVSGEPLTRSKRNLIEEAGAYVTLHYGPGDGTGGLLGCGDPEFIDEVHLPHSIFTLVEHARTSEYGGPLIRPLMFTTLHPSAPRFLLNVENGDSATVITRDCGCAVQKVGFTQHVHTVRSFEKMTSEGMNYSGSDLFELLEDTIPSEFGGGPGDYQLVEEEDDRGQTRLTFVVHPGVGNVNETKLLSRLHQGLAQGSRNHRFMSKIWQDAGAFRIRREAPYASARGKILPLRVKQKN
ncbi:MAG: hypothetical protein OEN50_03205, partial [Deltaproteobacteria bacterium]|nr:hypothetical protein [Deltaproteobacteria bacterium]